MGSWTIGYAMKPTKADIEYMVTKELTVGENGAVRKPLKMTTHILKDGAWDFVTHAVCEVNDTDADGNKVHYVCVYTVMSGKRCNESDEIIGKIMDETYGPNYAKLCPVTYLKGLTEPINEYSEAWRAEVIEGARIQSSKKVPLCDRKYKVGEEICSFHELVGRMGAPLYLFERSKKMKGQVIGHILVCNKIAFERVA